MKQYRYSIQLFFLVFSLHLLSGNDVGAQTSIAEPGGTVYTNSCSSGGPIGFAEGVTINIANPAWPSCLAWGISTTLDMPVMNGSINGPCGSYTTVRYYASGLTDLDAGIVEFSRTSGGAQATTFIRASDGSTYSNYTAEVRLILTITDGFGSPVPLRVTGGILLAGLPTPTSELDINARIDLKHITTNTALYETSGTGLPGAMPCSFAAYTCASYFDQWTPALQKYNCMATDATYQICSQFNPGTTGTSPSGGYYNGFTTNSPLSITGGPADGSNVTSTPQSYTWALTGGIGTHPSSIFEYNLNGGGWTTSSGEGIGTSYSAALNLGVNTFCVRYYECCNNSYLPNSSGECRTVYYTPVNACSGTAIDWGGNDWTLTNSTVSGTHYNIGDFTQSGTTSINQGCVFAVSATNITVGGTIDANGKGYAGGSGGGAGACSPASCAGITYCSNKDNCSAIGAVGGSVGTVGSGSGGGASGANGSTATGTKQDCEFWDDEGGRLCGGGGGAGGRGGCYGNAGGGSSGSGGNGTDPGVCRQSGCGVSCTSSGGAASGSACAGYGTNNGYNAIDMGSGGAGGGGGGRGYTAPTAGSTGGYGGGSVKLIASNTITVSGAINANGTDGGAGGNGGSAGNCGECCNDASGGCDERTYIGAGGGGGGAGGGSGGGIYIESSCGTVIISGSISATGGDGGSGGSGGSSGATGGGGSGGRIKIFYPTNSACNTLPVQGASVDGGTGSGAGSTGTFYSSANATYTITKGTIGSDQTICSGGTPAGLTSTLDASVSNCSVTPDYQWYDCTGGSCAVPSASSSGVPGGSWAPIGGASSNTYTPPALATSTYYVRRVLLGGCYYWSNVVTITVNPTPTASAGSDIATCTGTSAITMTGATAGGTYGSNTWSGGGGLGSWAQNADPALATFTPTVTAGSFTATLTVYGNGGCTGTDPTSTRVIVWGSSGDWIGAVDTDWFTAGNWCSAVPISTTDANIPSGVPNMPNISADGAVCKNLTIQSGASVTMSTSDTLTVYGDWGNSGTFNAGTAKVKFNGSALQLIQGSTTTAFNNVSVLNTAGITLNEPASISGQLLLRDGIITTDATNIITLTSTATATAGKSTSYINGPLIKQGGTDFIFPVGKNSKWARIGISTLSGADDFTAEYFDAPYADITSLNAPLQVVSTKEYWTLAPAGATQAKVRLYWEDNAFSGILNCVQNGDLVVAHFTGGLWEDMGSPTIIAGCTGSAPATGWVQSNNIPSFSPITFGSKDPVSNPLPIIYSSINAICDDENGDNNRITIAWITANEINNDFFTIERSFDASTFSEIATIQGNGSSYQQNQYTYTDSGLAKISMVYYKIWQTDFDGNKTVSGIIPVSCNKNISIQVEVFPIPAKNKIYVNIYSDEDTNGNIMIIDILGENTFSQNATFSKGSSLYEIDIKTLASGLYFLKVHSDKGANISSKIAVE